MSGSIIPGVFLRVFPSAFSLKPHCPLDLCDIIRMWVWMKRTLA